MSCRSDALAVCPLNLTNRDPILTRQLSTLSRRELLRRAGWQAAPEGVVIARTRHLRALAEAREHLVTAIAHADQRDAVLDLLAEELRLAHRALQAITGEFSADDLLGEIFGKFCIGK